MERGETITAGDGVAVVQAGSLALRAKTDAHVLMFDMQKVT
jgi:hypothetical protein